MREASSSVGFRWGRRIYYGLAPLLLCGLLGCVNPSSGKQDGGQAGTESQSRHSAGSVHDLSRDEDCGGHTLRKHVGRTDDQLRERLERERGISAASTYTDRATAEQVLGAVLEQEAPRIERWLDRSGNRPNLVLDYRGSSAIGRTMHHGESSAQPCADAKVVLRWTGGRDYYVLTSYPECRR